MDKKKLVLIYFWIMYFSLYIWECRLNWYSSEVVSFLAIEITLTIKIHRVQLHNHRSHALILTYLNRCTNPYIVDTNRLKFDLMDAKIVPVNMF
jgi:hypothetical protein